MLAERGRCFDLISDAETGNYFFIRIDQHYYTLNPGPALVIIKEDLKVNKNSLKRRIYQQTET